MPSSENIHARLRGRPFQGEIGDPCIYKGRTDLYNTFMRSGTVENTPLHEDTLGLDSDEDVYIYFQETYGDYLSDLGLIVGRYIGANNYIDVEHEPSGYLLACQEIKREFYPYMGQLLDELIDTVHYLLHKKDSENRPWYGLIDGAWVETTIEEREGRSPIVYRTYCGEEVQDIVQGIVPGALFYVNGDGIKTIRPDDGTEWSFIGDSHHALY